MMAGTRIKSSCPVCGEVEMPAKNVSLTVTEVDTGTYSFICPVCNDIVEKRADAKIIKLLMAVTEVRLEDATGDWDDAFSKELSCGDTHRWDFPVKMGQRCLCGKQVWDYDYPPPRPDDDAGELT